MSVLRRVWFLLRRRRLDRQLREEMDWHLQQRTRDLVAEGLDEAAARQAALRDFGNVALRREESRDWWGFVWLDLLLQDIRHAVRSLARQPLLTLIAVLSLGASMAACCAVFSLASTTLLATLPVPDPSRLVVLRWVSGPTVPYDLLDGWSNGTDRENSSTSFSYDAFLSARAHAAGRADVFGFADLYWVSVSAGGQSDVATGQLVSGNYFTALGLRPDAGRFIAPADDRVDAPEPVAVISHAYWQKRFGGRPDIVGATIRINQVPTVVIGVAPLHFNGIRQVGETADISVPIALRERFVRRAGIGPGQTSEDELPPFDPRYWWVNIMARLAPGVGVGPLQQAIDRAIRPSVVAARAQSAAREPFRVELGPGGRGLTELRDELVQPLTIMAAIVAVVIVIACANLATLLLARGAARDREVAVRHALGASRGRLMRALMVESLTIGLLGGLLGLVGTRFVAHSLLPALRLGDAASLDIGVSGLVLAFAFLTSLAAALLFGLIPAWRGTDVRSVGAIKEGTGSVVTRVPRLRTARAILTFQIAVSIVVLLAAGLLVGTMRNLERVQPGFDPRNVLLFRVDPTLNGYDQERIRRVYAELLARLGSLPGVEAVSFSHIALLSRSSSISTVSTVDGVKPASRLMANRLVVDPQFFRVMRIHLLAGSTFGQLQAESAVRPVVVNRTFAEQAFHTPAPIGHRFRFSDRPDKPTYQVAGVAADVRVTSLRQPVPPTVYFSYQQEATDRVNFALRVAVAPDSIVPAVRRTVAGVDPDLPIDRVRTQEDQIAQGIDRERLFATLATALGGLALFLACIGIYGVMAYAVSRRTTEIGVRLALGARPDGILLMVVGEAGRVVAVGVVLGLAGGLVTSRYLDSLLFGLAPTDPLAQALAVGLLIAVAAAAALVPARRAARTDPLIALRRE
jgi:predicted permease